MEKDTSVLVCYASGASVAGWHSQESEQGDLQKARQQDKRTRQGNKAGQGSRLGNKQKSVIQQLQGVNTGKKHLEAFSQNLNSSKHQFANKSREAELWQAIC